MLGTDIGWIGQILKSSDEARQLGNHFHWPKSEWANMSLVHIPTETLFLQMQGGRLFEKPRGRKLEVWGLEKGCVRFAIRRPLVIQTTVSSEIEK